MDFFHDRRPHSAPSEGDFIQPLTRATVTEANARIRAATEPYNLGPVNDRINSAAKERHRARRSGRGDFQSVGDYLTHMNGD